MPGVSIHVVDVARGAVAAGMSVALHAVMADGGEREIAAGRIAPSGLLPAAALDQRFRPGAYVATFGVADYYRSIGTPLPGVPFLGVVRFHFGIDDPEAHYHLPFKCTPWGYSCFRGGA